MSQPRASSSRQSSGTRERTLLLLAMAACSLILGMRLSHHAASAIVRKAGTAEEHPALMRCGGVLRSIGDPLQIMEWELQDFIHSHATPAPMRGDLVILGVDDASLEVSSAFPEDLEASPTLRKMKEPWPWSRAVYADAVERILASGAKAVVLDFAFTGPHYDAEGDKRFSQVFQNHPGKVFLGASFAEGVNSNGDRLPVVQFPWDGLVPPTNPPSPSIGFFSYWQDNDQVVRWVRHYYSKYEEIGRHNLSNLDRVPSLAAATLKATGLSNSITNDTARHWPRFSAATAYPPFSIHEMFVPPMWEQNFSKGAVFKDRIVLIGPAAPHMHDYFTTPVGQMLGVQLHAQVMAAALDNAWLRHLPPWMSLVDILLSSLAAWALVAFWKRPISTLLLLIVGSGLSLMARWWLFDKFNLVSDGVAPVLAFDLAGLVGISYDFMLERKQKLQLRNTLSRYFSPDLAEEILRDPDRFYSMASGTNRTITVLFSDVRGFTSLSETLPPQQLVLQLNQYLEKMVEVIFGHKGSIDKFIGDAIMAVWGRIGTAQTEASLNEEAINAVTTALRMRSGLVELNQRWAAEGQGDFQAGVGIHQGEAVVGNIGSTTRMEFTVIGDSVNTASRLESATKQYGVDLIISESVYARVRDHFVCRSADLVKVKGKSIPVGLFTVIHEIKHGKPHGLDAFEQGMVLYREGKFDDALSAFHEAKALGLDDALTEVFVERCIQLKADPPKDWDGVYTMTKK